MLWPCVLLLIATLAVAQESYSDTWKALYTLRAEPGSTTLQNAAWVWSQINAGAEVSFNASDIAWPTNDGDWMLASRFLEQPCTTNPFAPLCVAVCTKVPSWEYVSASEWDFCVHVQPERCTARIPGWEMPGNRLCWDQYRPHDQANNPLCPPGFISGSVNGSRPETMEMWCGEVSNSTAITVVPSYTQVLASSPWDTAPAVVEAIHPALVHDLPPSHSKFRYDHANGNMIECSISEMALTSECFPVYHYIATQWPASYCSTICGGAGTYTAANALNSDGSPSTSVCCYTPGCSCSPIDYFAEILEQGHTPFCLLVDSILSDTGTQPVSWWNQWREKNTFVSVSYRQEAGAPKLGIAPNGLDVWLIKLWGQGQTGVTEANSFCGRGRISDVQLCSAWGVFAGKCVPIASLISAVPLNDATDTPLTTSQALIEGQPWYLPTQTGGSGTVQHINCAVTKVSYDYRQASNPTLSSHAWCNHGTQYDQWGGFDNVPCYCLPQSHLLSYDGNRDKVSLCSPTTPRGQCLLASGLVNAPLASSSTIWGPRCYTTENDGAAKCAYTRAYRATNMLQNTAIAICAVRAFSVLGIEEGMPTYINTYKDQANPRALPYQMPNINNNHPTACQAECLAYGKRHGKTFKYIGLQDQTQCFCGEASDDYARYGFGATGGPNCKDGWGAAYCGGSWENAVYQIASDIYTQDRGGVHACRPARYFKQFQITNQPHTWSSTAPRPLRVSGCSQFPCGTVVTGTGSGCGTCSVINQITSTTCSGTCEGPQSWADQYAYGVCHGSESLCAPPAFFPVMMTPCSSATQPSESCWWTWEMISLQTYVTSYDRVTNGFQYNAYTEALNLCGSHSAYASEQCPHGSLSGSNSDKSHQLCVLSPQLPSNAQNAHGLCFPTELLGDRFKGFVTVAPWQTATGTSAVCMTWNNDGSFTVDGLCMMGWTQWNNRNALPSDTTAPNVGNVMSAQYSWKSGTTNMPSVGWGAANAYQQAARGYTTSQVTCGFTQYGNATNDAACAAIWSSSSTLLNPPSFGFVGGLLWPTSFSPLAPGTATYAPSQLRSSVHPDTSCYFEWTGVCKIGYVPANNVATQTLCCFGASSLCRCYPSTYTQREGLDNVGRTDSRWGAFSAQSQAAMCTPSTGIENPSPVCPTLPRWCLDLQHQPCASSCALGNQLSTTQQGEAYVACIRNNCNATALSGSSSGSFADCNYGYYCQGSMYNKCEGCSTFNEQLKVYNRTSATFSCQKLPSPYGGMMPVGLAGSRSEVAQPMQSPVQCGANTFASEGRYCQPCAVNHYSGAGASYCQACAAGTSRMYRYDFSSALASSSWSCVLDPSSCQLASPGSCESCQEGWQSNAGGLCVDCPGAYTLNPSWLGSTELAVAAGILACVGCPRGQIRRLSTSECVNCGSHEHIVRILPSAGTRLTFQEASRYGIATYILPDAESHGIFESLFCDFSGSCPAGTAIVPSHWEYKYCAACPPGMTGINCGIVCPYNHYNPEWGNSKCFQCAAGTHAPVANHNRQILQDLFAAVPVWAGARYCETSYHPPNSPSGMVVPRDTAYSTGWQEGALLNAAGFQTLSDPQACVRSCVETEQCQAISWTASNGACRMSTADTYTQLSSGTNTWIKHHAVTLSVAPPPPPASCLNLTYLTEAPVPSDIRETVAAMLQNGTLLPTNKTAFPPADNWNLQQIWLSVAPQDIQLCTPCPAGSFGPPVSTGGCFPCPPFAFSSTAGSTQCTLCPINTYTELVGSTACLPCPENTNTRNQTGVPCRFSNGTIATPPKGDEFCPPSTRLVGAVYNIQGQLVNLTCTQCGAGRYTTEYDQVTCQLCPPGQTNNAQHTGCQMCTNNTYSTQGVCTECAANTIASASHASCEPCPLGQGRALGAATCSTCADPDFNAMPGGGCGPCPIGYESFPNHTACYKCRSGFGRNAMQTQCTPCPAGQYSSTDLYTAGCQYCPRNRISDRAGQSSCVRCSRAEISNKVVGGTKCVSPFYSELLFLESMTRLEQILAGMGVLFAMFLLLRRPHKQKQS